MVSPWLRPLKALWARSVTFWAACENWPCNRPTARFRMRTASPVDSEFQAMIEEIDRIATQSQFQRHPTTGWIASRCGDANRYQRRGDHHPEPGRHAEQQRYGYQPRNRRCAHRPYWIRPTRRPPWPRLDAAISFTNTSRGDLGAQQNRMESTLRSIMNARENLSAAESRIRDVDVAAESRRPDA